MKFQIISKNVSSITLSADNLSLNVTFTQQVPATLNGQWIQQSQP